MITLNPNLPNTIMELERKESFGDVARQYGDSLAQHYEQNGIIYMPFMPIDCDFEFLQQFSFSAKLKKIGTMNGIEEPLIIRDGAQLKRNDKHPFLSLFPSLELALYFQAQVVKFNTQLRRGLSQLFPHYYSLREGNITWRFTETGREGLHFDVFKQGAPLTTEEKRKHRVKCFFNVDTLPRQWNVSYDMKAFLKNYAHELPDELPDDINVISDVVDRLGVLERVPTHSIHFPHRSAVIANGEVALHEVVFGRRTVGVEMHCDFSDMLDPSLHSHHALKGWLADAGIGVAADALEFSGRYKHLEGGYQRLQKAASA